jgi:hypothetical protein
MTSRGSPSNSTTSVAEPGDAQVRPTRWTGCSPNASSKVKEMAEPTTYREVIERTIAVIEDRIYREEQVPSWVMQLPLPLMLALDRNPLLGPR